MKLHHTPLTDVSRYLENSRQERLEDRRAEFDNYLRVLRRFVPLGPQSRILEVGTGTGWFPVLCAREGILCTGLEISPQLVENARAVGRQHGVQPDIRLGNIEEAELDAGYYDAVIANSVFEHVEYWREGLRRIYRTLRPGGAFFFISTNKFSPVSFEYDFPLYGWLPDRWRYRLRIARQGPDIMQLGIDFNQFTYPQLRRAFRQTGFSRIFDRLEVADPTHIESRLKRSVLHLARLPLCRPLVLTFCDSTIFVCIK